MKYTITILTHLADLLIFSACSDSIVSSSEADLTIEEFESEAEKRAPSPGNQTIADIVVETAAADEAEFTLLLAALEYTGLTEVFTGGDQYTVFAPVDQAFLNLVDALSADLDPDVVESEGPFAAIDDLLGEGAVANVLLYHVTEGRRAANSVVPKNMRAKDRKINTLLDGASFNVAFGGTISDIAGQEASITSADNSASNGIIHVIDTVLLPLE
ncbi:fasciclin domain-containing protein [Rhodohalobacter sp.]|uniref:fasciclin domain-containing protein n=1 Tax=Rhodohalobacter sp. TaxID=1974210 RepID=UPI003564F8A7